MRTSSLPWARADESRGTWRRLARLRNRLIGCFIGGETCGMVLLYLVLHRASQAPLFWLSYCALFASCLVALGGGWLALRCQSQLVKLVQQTLQSGDIHTLPCWIELLFASGAQACNSGAEGQVRTAAETGLLETLPLLTEETASLLSVADRRALYRAFKGQNQELISVLLQVVPLLGDACALPYVQHLAEGKGAVRQHPELQAEAQSVLVPLQDRVALRHNASGLLRASPPPQTSPEELLLPVRIHKETPPDELLRAENRK